MNTHRHGPEGHRSTALTFFGLCTLGLLISLAPGPSSAAPCTSDIGSSIAQLSSDGRGLGGTGYGGEGDGRGLGGTGLRGTGADGDGRGIGGTGRSDDSGRGLGGTGWSGGTGFLGTIDGLGSLCLNGERVTFDEDSVFIQNGRASDSATPAVGHVAAVEARRDDTGQWKALHVETHHVLVGPVESVSDDGKVWTVLGETVRIESGVLRPTPEESQVGDTVAVSGLPAADGSVLATRVDAAPDNAEARMLADLQTTTDGGYTLNGHPLQLPSEDSLPSPGTVIATGHFDREGVFIATSVEESPARRLAARVARISIEALVRNAQTTGTSLHATAGGAASLVWTEPLRIPSLPLPEQNGPDTTADASAFHRVAIHATTTPDGLAAQKIHPRPHHAAGRTTPGTDHAGSRVQGEKGGPGGESGKHDASGKHGGSEGPKPGHHGGTKNGPGMHPGGPGGHPPHHGRPPGLGQPGAGGRNQGPGARGSRNGGRRGGGPNGGGRPGGSGPGGGRPGGGGPGNGGPGNGGPGGGRPGGP